MIELAPQEAQGREPALARPLSVLFINDTSRNGGPGRTLFYILKFLDPQVIRRSVMVPREGVVTELLRGGGVTEELFTVPRFIENIVEPWDRAIARDDFDAPLPLQALRAVGNVARATLAMTGLARRIRRERYDLIFCNGTSANFAGAALAGLTGVPAVWHVFYTHVGKPILPVHARLARSAGVKSILCVSKPTTRLVSHCMDKVKIVGDSIDADEYDASRITPIIREKLGVGSDTVIFGSQGRVLPRKGYAEMVRAAKLAVSEMTAAERSRVRFVVYGDTPEDMTPNHLEECRALVRELGLEGTFLFPGYVPDVKPYVAGFDVAVIPSVYEDPLPRAVMEAMALSKPVVAFAVGGIPEMVEDGKTGALVSGSPPDVPGLARAMLGYFRDAEKRRQHGEASRAVVRTRLEASVHARALQDEMVRAARK